MKKGIIATDAEFIDLNKRVVKYMRNKGHKLTAWCEKTVHITDSRLVFRTTEKIEAILTSTEKTNIIELTNDWFPVEEII